MSVVDKALSTIDWTGKKLLVACSGGLDSTVLLHGLISIGQKPEVLHVNYGLRDVDSEADEAFVRHLAQKFELNLNVNHCPKELLKGEGINLQAAARDFRWQLFAEWKAHSPDHVVILGHHADDQLETFFLQLFRGSGTFGLGGMHAERDQLIRPFLEISKEELRIYAKFHDLEWREDLSNASGVYLRNVWRNELLPELISQSPTLRESILLMMRCFRERQLELTEAVKGLAVVWKDAGSLDIQAWKSMEADEKQAFVRVVNLPFWTVDRLNELSEGRVSSSFNLGQGRVIREKNRLIYQFDRTKNAPWDFKIEEIGILPPIFDKATIYLDPSKLKGELRFRPWVAGDRIQSKGLKGSQLVSDILKDAGIPLADRSDIQVLTDGYEVLWVPGLKVGRTALATQTSGTILKIIIHCP